MTRKLMLLLTLLISSVCFGQMQVQDTPDCQIGLDSNGTNTDSAVIDNRFIGCTSWTLYYSSTGFSADSLEFQSAPDSSGAPGAFVTWANIDSGSSLPLTSTTGGQVMGFRFQPWAKIHINSTTGTGRIIAKLIGYKPFKGATDPTNGSQLVTIASGTINAQGTVAQGTSGVGVNPVLIGGCPISAGICATNITPIAVSAGGVIGIAGGAAFAATGQPSSAFRGPNASDAGMGVIPYWYNGTNADANFYCNTTKFISALGAATTEIVPLVAAKKIRVCSINFGNTNATATNIKLVEGTGANCATGQTQLTGNFIVPASSNLVVPVTATAPYITNTAADALCATGSAAGAVDITITIAQY